MDERVIWADCDREGRTELPVVEDYAPMRRVPSTRGARGAYSGPLDINSPEAIAFLEGAPF